MENGWTLTNTYESLSLVGHMLKKNKKKKTKTLLPEVANLERGLNPFSGPRVPVRNGMLDYVRVCTL